MAYYIFPTSKITKTNTAPRNLDDIPIFAITFHSKCNCQNVQTLLGDGSIY